MTREQRQNGLITALVERDFNGTVVAATGFGKTRVGLGAIYRFMQKKPQGRVLVIVPTIDLSVQWRGLIDKLMPSFSLQIAVLVINTAYKSEEYYDLYVLDEAHRYGAPEFSKIFRVIKNSPTIMLTATIERTDGADAMLLAKSPVIDKVSVEECLREGWVSSYSIYNLPVNFTAEEQAEYNNVDYRFKRAAALVGGMQEAMLLLKTGNPEQKRNAVSFMRYMRERKTLCQTGINKLPAVLECLQKFNTRRTVVFSEDISFADSVYNAIPEQTILLHSGLKAKERRAAKATFEMDKSKLVLATVRAANEGIDIPDLSMAIIAAGNSQKRDMIQRIGRTIRNLPGKHAIIINLYIPNTQSEVWLKNALKDFKSNVFYIRSLDEIPYTE